MSTTVSNSPIDTKRVEQARAATRARIAGVRPKVALGIVRTWPDLCAIVGTEIKNLGDFTPENRELYYEWAVDTAGRRAEEEIKRQAEANTAVEIEKFEVNIPGLTLKPQQVKAVNQIISAYRAGKRAVIVAMGTGRGKTIVLGAVAWWFRQQGLISATDNVFLPQCLVNTKKPVVLATRDKLEKFFKFTTTGDNYQKNDADLGVYHYSTWSTAKWRYMWRTDKETGELIPEKIDLYGAILEVPFMRLAEPIKLVALDECHELKKPNSSRSRRVLGMIRANATKNAFYIFMSATPAITLRDTWLFNIAAGFAELDNMSQFLGRFGSKPDKPNKEAMERYNEFLGIHRVAPPEDRLKYKTTYKVDIVQFPDEATRRVYREAEEDYVKSVLDSGGTPGDTTMAKFTIFRRAAEVSKAPLYAARMLADMAEGRSPVLAVEFIDTVISVASLLAKAGVPRERISLIWGGQKLIRPEEVYTTAEFAAVMDRIRREAERYEHENGIAPEDEFFCLTDAERTKVRKTREYNRQRLRRGETKAEQRERVGWLAGFDLDKQTDVQRYNEVNRFLRDETHCCVFTFAAGGTGIDLDNQIPGGRQRVVYSTMCYWAEQWLQAFGRCARIMTQSDVAHYILLFDDSIEVEHVLPKLAPKLRSIKTLTGIQGDLEDIVEQAIVKEAKTVKPKLTQADLSFESEDLLVDEAGDDDDDAD